MSAPVMRQPRVQQPGLNPAREHFCRAPARTRVLYRGRVASKVWDSAGVAVVIACRSRARILRKRQLQNRIGFNVADSGDDQCALVYAHGPLVRWADQWQASEDELLASTVRAVQAADANQRRSARSFQAIYSKAAVLTGGRVWRDGAGIKAEWTLPANAGLKFQPGHYRNFQPLCRFGVASRQ